jgi:hypothetical protein
MSSTIITRCAAWPPGVASTQEAVTCTGRSVPSELSSRVSCRIGRLGLATSEACASRAADDASGWSWSSTDCP